MEGLGKFISNNIRVKAGDLNADPKEWQNLADKGDVKETISMPDGFIPKAPADFPVQSLIPLLEHRIAPIQSRAHYESKERRDWMKRFENIT